MAVWVFGLFYVAQLDLQEYFVVHYWMEGVWEVSHISLVGFLLVLMFKADVKPVGFAVFWGIALVWLSGLIGNAHHYFWIGTPAFWQFWGSLFSTPRPLPLVFCFWHIYLHARINKRPWKTRRRSISCSARPCWNWSAPTSSASARPSR
jgi:nitric oxide reductase subunit B